MEVEFGGCSSRAQWLGNGGGRLVVLWGPEMVGDGWVGVATAMAAGWQQKQGKRLLF